MSTIASSHPLNVGTIGDYGADSANRALYEADVVLAIGTSLGSMTTKNWLLIKAGTTIIQVDVSGEEIGRNYPTEVPLVGDATAVLRQLAETKVFSAPKEWLDRIDTLRTEWRAVASTHETSDAIPMRPERLWDMVSNVIADDAIVVGDTGHVGHWTAQHLKLGENQTMIRAAGSLGWGVPAAIGAKAAAPGREVVLLTGDGGFYYHIAELETALRYDLPVIIIVNNNGSLNQETFLWDLTNPLQEKNWKFADVDLAKVAEGFGCFGARVDDPADFQAAFEAARASGKPAVLDVRTAVDALAPGSWTPDPNAQSHKPYRG